MIVVSSLMNARDPLNMLNIHRQGLIFESDRCQEEKCHFQISLS